MSVFTSDNFLLKWKETYELSFELAEISYILLNQIADYCHKHNIPLYQEQGTLNLMKKARAIIKEIEVINSCTFNSQKIVDKNKKQTGDDFSHGEKI